jgi:hypothetical protein
VPATVAPFEDFCPGTCIPSPALRTRSRTRCPGCRRALACWRPWRHADPRSAGSPWSADRSRCSPTGRWRRCGSRSSRGARGGVTETEAVRLDRGGWRRSPTRRCSPPGGRGHHRPGALPTELQPGPDRPGHRSRCRPGPGPGARRRTEGQGSAGQGQGGGRHGRGLPAVKPWELPQFVSAEAKQLGTAMEPARPRSRRCRGPRPAGPGRGRPPAGGGQRGRSAVGGPGPALLRRTLRGDQLRGGRRRRWPGGTGLAMEQLRSGPLVRAGSPPVLVTARAGRRRSRWGSWHRRQRPTGGRTGAGGRCAAWEAQEKRAQARAGNGRLAQRPASRGLGRSG